MFITLCLSPCMAHKAAFPLRWYMYGVVEIRKPEIFSPVKKGLSRRPTKCASSLGVLCDHTASTGPGRVAQSVTCLTADPGVASSIPVRSHTFVEIDHEMISTGILLLPLIHSRRVVVSYKRKYVHEFLVNRLFKPAQEKVWLGELTVPQ